VGDFKTLCAADPLINFAVPDRIGIGVARGAASRLHSGNLTLDYSGRVLNLAARLLDLARPQGVVIDGGFKIGLLPAALQARFRSDDVYIRGVANKAPIQVHFTKDLTTIPLTAKHAVDVVNWRRITERVTPREVKARGLFFLHQLPSVPSDASQINIRVSYPIPKSSGKKTGLARVVRISDYEYYMEADQPIIRVNYGALGVRLAKAHLSREWPVDLVILYPE
jgi:hypothetical protein